MDRDSSDRTWTDRSSGTTQERAAYGGTMIARTGAALLLVPWIWIALSGELRGLPPVAFAAYVAVLVLAVASAVLGWATKPGSPPAGLVGRWNRERMQVAVIAQWLLAIFIAASLIAYVVLPE